MLDQKLLESIILGIKLSKNNIKYYIEKICGESTIVIPMNLVGDKNRLSRVMANIYESQRLFDKSGFSDFLYKCHKGGK
ncbi:hypothetical protein ES702_05424 [subsurface metagenome]